MVFAAAVRVTYRDTSRQFWIKSVPEHISKGDPDEGSLDGRFPLKNSRLVVVFDRF